MLSENDNLESVSIIQRSKSIHYEKQETQELPAQLVVRQALRGQTAKQALKCLRSTNVFQEFEEPELGAPDTMRTTPFQPWTVINRRYKERLRSDVRSSQSTRSPCANSQILILTNLLFISSISMPTGRASTCHRRQQT
jgi:hypothetical protein